MTTSEYYSHHTGDNIVEYKRRLRYDEVYMDVKVYPVLLTLDRLYEVDAYMEELPFRYVWWYKGIPTLREAVEAIDEIGIPTIYHEYDNNFIDSNVAKQITKNGRSQQANYYAGVFMNKVKSSLILTFDDMEGTIHNYTFSTWTNGLTGLWTYDEIPF